jgi:hypothetical protein
VATKIVNLSSRSSQFILLAIVLLGASFGLFPVDTSRSINTATAPESPASPDVQIEGDGDEQIAQAYANRLSDLQVRLVGRVDRLLSDDREGSRHQRFILRLTSGRTLLVAHNIDLAPRVEGLAQEDRVELFGEYEWNRQGG